LWIWGDQQTRHPAAEVGVAKGTLTGGLKTLEMRGLLRKIIRSVEDGWDRQPRHRLVRQVGGSRGPRRPTLC
jgi:hypothetical protein